MSNRREIKAFNSDRMLSELDFKLLNSELKLAKEKVPYVPDISVNRDHISREFMLFEKDDIFYEGFISSVHHVFLCLTNALNKFEDYKTVVAQVFEVMSGLYNAVLKHVLKTRNDKSGCNKDDSEHYIDKVISNGELITVSEIIPSFRKSVKHFNINISMYEKDLAKFFNFDKGENFYDGFVSSLTAVLDAYNRFNFAYEKKEEVLESLILFITSIFNIVSSFVLKMRMNY